MEIITAPPLPFMSNFQTPTTPIHGSASCDLMTHPHVTHQARALVYSTTCDLTALRAWPWRGDTVRSHPNSDIRYPISNLQSPSLQPIRSTQSPRLFPGHQTSRTPSTFDHAQLYLGNPSIISAYPALITDVTGFSIVPPLRLP